MAVFGEEQREEGIAGVAQRASDEVRHRVDAGIEGTKKLVRGGRRKWCAAGQAPQGVVRESSPGGGAAGSKGGKGGPLELLGGGAIADALSSGGETGNAKGKVPGGKAAVK